MRAMSDSNAWRQVRWMVLPALAGFGAMAGASDRDAFAEGRRVLQEAKRDFERRPRPRGPRSVLDRDVARHVGGDDRISRA